MRRLWVMAISVIFAGQPMMAVNRLTVNDLREAIATRIAAHDRDEDLARRIGTMELSERLTDPSLDAILSNPSLGPKTKQSLHLLADSSAFLDPPASELPKKTAPDVAEQQKIMNGAVGFVATTFRHLPDFLALRETQSFDNSPLAITHSGWAPANTELHLVGRFQQEITYRGGREVSLHSVTKSGLDAKQDTSPPGLASTGEFGPVLATILRDASKGAISWSHWEQTPTGLAAVFNYKVPEPASHYEVDFCCVRGSEDAKSYSGESSDGANSYRGTPAYHGSLSIDPDSGSILRVTLDPELKADGPVMRSAIAVDYGPVEIGGKRYICPVHSIAISLARTRLGGDLSERTILRVNEVKFTNYHRFGSSSRIVPSDTEPE